MKAKKKNQPTSIPNLLGSSYVKIPRNILDMTLSLRTSERNKGRLLSLLFSLVYFKDGFVQDRDTNYICKRGCCIVNVPKLATLADIKTHAGHRYLRELERDGYIELNRTVYATMIKILNFDTFMKEFAPPAPAPPVAPEQPTAKPPEATDPQTAKCPENKPFVQQPRKNLGNDYWSKS